MMQTHPAIAAALADEHRRTLIAEAESSRLARAARDGRDVSAVRPTRWFLPRRHPGPRRPIRTWYPQLLARAR